MLDLLLVWALQREDAGGGVACLECADELVEPTDLAPGEPAGAGCDGLFGQVGRELAGDVEEHLSYADGFAHRGVWDDAGFLEVSRLFGAVSHYSGGACAYVTVEDVPGRPQVEEVGVVEKFPVPDRTPLRSPQEPEFQSPGLAPRVFRACHESLGLRANLAGHLRGQGDVEDEGVQVHAGARIEHEGEARREGIDYLFGALFVTGNGPLLGYRDYSRQFSGTDAGLVGHHRYLPVDLHGVHQDRGRPGSQLAGESFRQSVGEGALAGGGGTADDERPARLARLLTRGPQRGGPLGS